MGVASDLIATRCVDTVNHLSSLNVELCRKYDIHWITYGFVRSYTVSKISVQWNFETSPD